MIICPTSLIYNHAACIGLKLKLKTNLYSAKSEDSEALDGGTSQLSSQREYGEIKMS